MSTHTPQEIADELLFEFSRDFKPTGLRSAVIAAIERERAVRDDLLAALEALNDRGDEHTWDCPAVDQLDSDACNCGVIDVQKQVAVAIRRAREGQ
jgi:hypothetical protein